jgi:hypothetical protein
VLHEALDLSLALHSIRNVILCLVEFAQLAFDESDSERAALLMGAAEGLRRRAGLRRGRPRGGRLSWWPRSAGRSGRTASRRSSQPASRLNRREAVAAAQARAARDALIQSAGRMHRRSRWHPYCRPSWPRRGAGRRGRCVASGGRPLQWADGLGAESDGAGSALPEHGDGWCARAARRHARRARVGQLAVAGFV